MATLDKEIQVLMLKGEKGYSSYEEAVANELFSGTLEEWIETFATPDNYITRAEYKKVTQAEYDALVRDNAFIPDCYYFITDDDSWQTILSIIANMNALSEDVDDVKGDITTLNNDLQSAVNDISGLDSRLDDVENALARTVNTIFVSEAGAEVNLTAGTYLFYTTIDTQTSVGSVVATFILHIDDLTTSKKFVSTDNSLGIGGTNYNIEYDYNEALGGGKLYVNYWQYVTETGGTIGKTVNFFKL